MTVSASRKVRSDLFLALFSNTFDKIVALLIVFLAARRLSQEAVGEMFFVLAYVSIAVIFTNVGAGGHLTRTVAQDPEHALEQLSSFLSVRLLLLGIILGGMLLFVSLWQPELLSTTFLTALYVSFQELFFTFSALFLGLRIIAPWVVVSIISKVVLIGLAFWALSSQPSLSTMLWSFVVAYGFQLILIFLTGWFLVGRARWTWHPGEARELLGRGWPFIAITAMTLIYTKIDTFMLGVLYSLVAVAIYEIAYKFLEVSRFVIRPVRQIYLAIYTDMRKKGQWEQLMRNAGTAVILAALAGLAAFIFVLVFGPMLITTLFGPSYAEAIPVIRILFLGAPALFVGFICHFLAIALGLERQVIRLLIAAVILNVVLNAAVIPRWGATGAAVTTIISELVMAILLLQLCWSRMRHWSAEGPAEPGPSPSFTTLDDSRIH